MSQSKSTYGKGRLLAALVAVFTVAISSQGTAHALVTPLLSNLAVSSGLLYDSAVLGNGQNPTGALTFRLYGPSDPTCAGTPVFTTATKVTGNGYYESARYDPTVAGTYRWISVYGGDANNAPSAPTRCNDPSGQAIVGKRQPKLTAAPSTALPNSADTAVLANGMLPTGTLTFRLYGPDNTTCTGSPMFTSTKLVLGNGSYTSDPKTPTVPGRYRWLVSYSGDLSNVAQVTTCSDTNAFTQGARPAVTATPATVGRGGTVTVTWSNVSSPTSGDWVGLYKTGLLDLGLTTKWAYTKGTANGSLTLVFPWGTLPGTYEVRLMANGTTQRLATSAPIKLVW